MVVGIERFKMYMVNRMLMYTHNAGSMDDLPTHSQYSDPANTNGREKVPIQFFYGFQRQRFHIVFFASISNRLLASGVEPAFMEPASIAEFYQDFPGLSQKAPYLSDGHIQHPGNFLNAVPLVS